MILFASSGTLSSLMYLTQTKLTLVALMLVLVSLWINRYFISEISTRLRIQIEYVTRCGIRINNDFIFIVVFFTFYFSKTSLLYLTQTQLTLVALMLVLVSLWINRNGLMDILFRRLVLYCEFKWSTTLIVVSKWIIILYSSWFPSLFIFSKGSLLYLTQTRLTLVALILVLVSLWINRNGLMGILFQRLVLDCEFK